MKVALTVALGLGLASAWPMAKPAAAEAKLTAAGANSTAAALLQDARRLEATGNTAVACAKYRESYSIAAELEALLPWAACLESDGKLASAYAAFADAAELAERREDARAAVARDHAARLRSRLSYLTIEVPLAQRLPALSVELDGFRIGSSGWGVPMPVDPGTHVVVVTAYGRQTWRASIEAPGEASSSYLQVPLLDPQSDSAEIPAAPTAAVAEPPATPTAAPKAPVRPSTVGSPQAPPRVAPSFLTPTRTAALVAGGISALSLGTGFYLLEKTNSTLDERDGICPSGKGCAPGTNAHLSQLTSSAVRSQRAEIACFALAGGAAAMGLGLWFFPKPSKRQGDSALLVPVIIPSVAALTLQGSL